MRLVTRSMRIELIVGFLLMGALYWAGLGVGVVRVSELTHRQDAATRTSALAQRLTTDAYAMEASALRSGAPASTAGFRNDFTALSSRLGSAAERSDAAAITTALQHWSAASPHATTALAAATSALSTRLQAESTEAAAHARDLTLSLLIGFGLLAAAFGAFVVDRLCRHVVGGVRRVVRAVRALARGEVDHDIPIRGHDEIAALSRAVSELIAHQRATVA